MHNRRGMIRVLAVALLLYALASLLTVGRRLTEAQMAAYGDAEEMRRLAWERLGMVMPGETVYIFTDGTE